MIFSKNDYNSKKGIFLFHIFYNMYPYLLNFGQFQVSSFGISITLSFFAGVWMLYKLSKKHDFDFDIFKNNILWLFISSFFFARLFYIISKWYDFKGIQNPLHFFIANEFNFSLFGGIFGFLLIFFILLRLRKEKLEKYIYGIVTSFIFILPIAYFGALLGGQIYGIDTNFGIEITYTRADTPVPYTSALFPLPIFYSILFFLLFCGLYISDMYFKEKNILGFAGILFFCGIIFTMEFFSGKIDIFKEYIGINFSQIGAIIFFAFAAKRIYKIYNKETKRW